MHVVFLLSDHLLSQYNNQVSESLTLMDQTLLDVMELDAIVHLMVQVLDQDLVLVVVESTLVVEVVALMALKCQSKIHLAQKVLIVQKIYLLFLEAFEVSEG